MELCSIVTSHTSSVSMPWPQIIQWLYRKPDTAESSFTHLSWCIQSSAVLDITSVQLKTMIVTSVSDIFVITLMQSTWAEMSSLCLILWRLCQTVKASAQVHKGSSWRNTVLYLVSCSHWWKALACCANSWRSLSFSSCLLCSFCSSSSRSYTHIYRPGRKTTLLWEAATHTYGFLHVIDSLFTLMRGQP